MLVLICISSRSPNPYLHTCIEKLYKHQIKDTNTYHICVIDSDSDDLTQYSIIEKSFPDVEIWFAKNKNYEYGAWKYALNKYPNYDVYFCIQDTIVLHSYVDLNFLNDKTACTYHDRSGYQSRVAHINHDHLVNRGLQNLKDNGIECDDIVHTRFNMATHNSFIVNNKIMKDIFATLTVPPVDKIGCCFYERNFGLYFILKGIDSVDLRQFVDKYHGNRL